MQRIKRNNGYYLIRRITGLTIQSIVCIADIHLGHKNFNEKKLKEVIKWIQDKNALWFGGGDLIENSNKNSVSAGWAEQVFGPQEQINEVVKLLKPISDKCLGLLNGNHEDRAYKDTGINPTEIIANMLGVPAAGDEIFIIIASDRGKGNRGKGYTIYGCHTKIANRSPGLAFNYMQRLKMGWVNTDVICKAHGHDMGLSPPSIRISIDTQNTAIVEHEMYYWLVGHYLDRPDSYVSKQSSQPKPLGTVAINLDMDINKKKRITNERI